MTSSTAVVANRRVVADQRWAVFIGLVVLNAVDVLTTVLVLGRGGVEGNPFIRPMIDGVWQVSMLKAAILVIVGLLLTRSRGSRIAEFALTATTGWYLAVVAWNLVVLSMI